MLAFLILLLVPFALLLAAFRLCLHGRAVRRAHGRHVRIHWRLSVAAHLLYAYAMLLLALLAADSKLGAGRQFAVRWPSLAGLSGMTGTPDFLLLLDAAAVLVLALVLLAARRSFGHFDDAGIWHPPLRALREEAADHERGTPQEPN